MPIIFRSRILPEGVLVTAHSKGLIRSKTVPYSEWASVTEKTAAVVVRVLNGLIAQGAATEAEDGALLVAHESIPPLSASLSDRLGLPPLARVSATLSFEGRVESPEGRIRMRWHDLNSRPLTASRSGCFLKVGDELGRLSEPVFRLTEAVDAYNSSHGEESEQRISHWCQVQEALQGATGQNISTDGYLGSLTIYQAGAFALDIRETSAGPDFTPILMSREKGASLEDLAPTSETGEDESAGQLKDERADALLPPELQKKFVLERYEASSRTRDAYVLGRNTFVILEPELKQALDVVRRLRSAPLESRRAFIRNPRPAIAEALGEDGDILAASLFVETQQYSDRVLGLGVWARPVLPWLQSKAGQWLPEKFAIKLKGKHVVLSQEEVEHLANEVRRASEDGQEFVTFQGNDYSVNEVEQALGGISPAEEVSIEEGAHEEEDPSEPEIEEDLQVLLIKPNLDTTDYQSRAVSRHSGIAEEIPVHLMGASKPKLHQLDGFHWLVKSWQCGLPGVLLADDMGLGKTYQTLAFLAWLQANRHHDSARLTPRQKGPVLVVAPTALLNNWIAEADQHLAPNALGERIEAFGPGLKQLKRTKTAEWTPEDALDVDLLRTTDWILTTYETLADNHRAFARIAYSVVVFDEMQKIKDPRTINTHAAKAMNAEFVLGLTGTPIENRLEDLWCIMDRVVPGALGDLKTFSDTYTEEQSSQLEELKAKLDQPQAELPPLMLRRMKEDHIEGLPQRTMEHYPTQMPSAQADAYMEAVQSARSGARTHGAMLKVIHALRGISLHPHGADEVDPYDGKSANEWIGRSARISRTIEILRGIEEKGEKALLFIEDRAVQQAMAGVAVTLFGLHEEPAIINGQVPGHRRQEIVRRFQNGPRGFDLLVLSPKAAGIGLTITAANHVIHLSRWWNPAVEDQCNDRCYRIGQDKPVSVHIPMAIHPLLPDASFDVTLDQLLSRKRNLSRNMLAPPVAAGDVDAIFGSTIGTP